MKNAERHVSTALLILHGNHARARANSTYGLGKDLKEEKVFVLSKHDREDLAGAKRSHELQIRLKPAANLHRRIARTNHALSFAPGREHREMFAKEHSEPLDKAVINAHQTQSAPVGLQIGSHIVKAGKRLAKLRQETT